MYFRRCRERATGGGGKMAIPQLPIVGVRDQEEMVSTTTSAGDDTLTIP